MRNRQSIMEQLQGILPLLLFMLLLIGVAYAQSSGNDNSDAESLIGDSEGEEKYRELLGDEFDGCKQACINQASCVAQQVYQPGTDAYATMFSMGVQQIMNTLGYTYEFAVDALNAKLSEPGAMHALPDILQGYDCNFADGDPQSAKFQSAVLDHFKVFSESGRKACLELMERSSDVSLTAYP